MAQVVLSHQQLQQITANLSKGFSLYESVSIAHKYVYNSILKAPNLGSGHGPLNHFHVIPD